MLDFQSKVIKRCIVSQLPVIKQQFKVFCSPIKPSFKTVQKKKSPVSSLKTSNTQMKKKDTVDFLNEEFQGKETVEYFFEKIQEEQLNIRPEDYRLKVCRTIISSAKYQVMVFTPYQKTIKAATRMCLCDNCKQNYGSCSLFVIYDPVTGQLKGAAFRLSNVQEAIEPIDHSSTEFMYPDSVCAIAADSGSQYLVWFLKTDKIAELIKDSVNNYGHHLAARI